jgi:hypothetical protein
MSETQHIQAVGMGNALPEFELRHPFAFSRDFLKNGQFYNCAYSTPSLKLQGQIVIISMCRESSFDPISAQCCISHFHPFMEVVLRKVDNLKIIGSKGRVEHVKKTHSKVALCQYLC